MNLSKDDFINMLERMASYGTAPENGCSLFGVGYEEAYLRIRKKYLEEQFGRGVSAEKFVVGPFGSGKTHFLRQLMEIARQMDCVTSEVTLNKDVDFTKSLIVYGEIVRELRTPYSTGYGINSLINGVINKIRDQVEEEELKDIVLGNWVKGVDKVDYKLDMFGKVMKKALIAKIDGDEIIFEMCSNWLGGVFNDTGLSKELGVPRINKSSNNLYAKRAMLSLFQFIKHAGFRGTVVCFDEAEQGLSVDKRKTDKILSMLMSGIEAITNLNKGSALLVYALTPDLVEKMKTFPALQQRITSPPGRSFFDGNVLAPLIELRREEDDPTVDLKRIGYRLVEVFLNFFGEEITVTKELLENKIDEIADEIVEIDLSSSNRRDMVKSTCWMLLNVIDTGQIEAAVSQDIVEETEV